MYKTHQENRLCVQLVDLGDAEETGGKQQRPDVVHLATEMRN